MKDNTQNKTIIPANMIPTLKSILESTSVPITANIDEIISRSSPYPYKGSINIIFQYLFELLLSEK